MYGKEITKEHRKNLSERKKGDKNHFYGKTHTEETKRKMSEFQKGKIIIYNKELDIEKNIKEENELLYYLNNGYKRGKRPVSKETRRKISEGRMGCPSWNKGRTGVYSEETRKKMSEARKGRAPWNKGVKMSDKNKLKLMSN